MKALPELGIFIMILLNILLENETCDTLRRITFKVDLGIILTIFIPLLRYTMGVVGPERHDLSVQVWSRWENGRCRSRGPATLLAAG